MNEQNDPEAQRVVLKRFEKAKERRNVWEGHWQFSCWNANDPNRAKLEAVGVGNKIFDQCLRIARQAVDGELEDSVSGATHYHVDGLSPPWAKSREPVAKVGRHVFYKDIG